MLSKLCRLCLERNDLIWIFDSQLEQNIQEIIENTCSIQIEKTDAVTQMVCKTCLHISIKMYRFKTMAINSDKYLKAQLAGYALSKLTSNNEDSHNISSGSLNSAQEKENEKNSSLTKNSPDDSNLILEKENKKATEKTEIYVHPSVKEIMTNFPNYKIPKECRKLHLGAYITVLTNEVDEWYRDRGSSDEDIKKLKNEAFELEEERKKRKVDLETDNVIHSKRSKLNDGEKIEKTEEKTNKTEGVSEIDEKNFEKPEVQSVNENSKLNDEHNRHENLISRPELIEPNEGVVTIISDSEDDNRNVEDSNTNKKNTQVSNSPNILTSDKNKSCKLYTCRQCGSQHNSRNKLRKHVRMKHTECRFCRKRFKSVKSCDTHVKSCRIVENVDSKSTKTVTEIGSSKGSIEKNEDETSGKTINSFKPKITVVNEDLLSRVQSNVNNNSDILKEVLWDSLTVGKFTQNYLIEESPSRQTTIFKNLMEHVCHYDIPVKMKCNPNFMIKYTLTEEPPIRKMDGLWGSLLPENLKPINPRNPSLPPKSPTQPEAEDNSLLSPFVRHLVKILPKTSPTVQSPETKLFKFFPEAFQPRKPKKTQMPKIKDVCLKKLQQSSHDEPVLPLPSNQILSQQEGILSTQPHSSPTTSKLENFKSANLKESHLPLPEKMKPIILQKKPQSKSLWSTIQRLQAISSDKPPTSADVTINTFVTLQKSVDQM